MSERTVFESLEVGEKFRTVGKITGNLSLYTYVKIDPLAGQDGLEYNARASYGKHETLRYESFDGHEYVEKV